jgi:effector-binding domain-containing protein
MGIEVTVRTVAAVPTAVVAATTTWPEFPLLWKGLLDQVYACVRDHHQTRQGRNVMLYLDEVPHVEVGVEVTTPCALDPPVRASTLPAGQVAVAVNHGPYEHLGRTHEAIRSWSAATGRRLTGVRWEIYGHITNPDSDPETEVYYQLA